MSLFLDSQTYCCIALLLPRFSRKYIKNKLFTHFTLFTRNNLMNVSLGRRCNAEIIARYVQYIVTWERLRHI